MTEVEICNLALGYLGTNPLVALSDDTAEARLCNAFYYPVKRSLLEERNWSFAKGLWAQAPAVTPTNTPWVAAYDISDDCLRVHRVDDGNGTYDIEWERVGAQILTDREVATLYIEGVQDVNSEAGAVKVFSYAFCFALAARLASEICIPLTENTTLWQSMHQLAEKKLKEAAGSDGSQGKSEQVRSASSLKQRR